MNVRTPKDFDRLQLADLYNEWDQCAVLRLSIATDRDLSDFLIAVDDNNQVAGFIRGDHEQSHIWRNISGYEHHDEFWTCSTPATLFIGERHRRRGIGSLLMDAFEEKAKRYGNNLVVVNPAPLEDGEDPELLSFYFGLGYRKSEEVRQGFEPYLLIKDI